MAIIFNDRAVNWMSAETSLATVAPWLRLLFRYSLNTPFRSSVVEM